MNRGGGGEAGQKYKNWDGRNSERAGFGGGKDTGGRRL